MFYLPGNLLSSVGSQVGLSGFNKLVNLFLVSRKVEVLCKSFNTLFKSNKQTLFHEQLYTKNLVVDIVNNKKACYTR